MTTNLPTKSAMDDFKAAYEAEFKEKLTDEQAGEIAFQLLKFFQMMGKAK